MTLRAAVIRLLALVLVSSCAADPIGVVAADAPRDAMRTLVMDLSSWMKARVPGFIVIAQNGEELLTDGESAAGPLNAGYLDALDGLGREDLFFGYTADNVATPPASTRWMLSYLDRATELERAVWVIDYCWDDAYVAASSALSAAHGFVSFQAPSRLLDRIPEREPLSDAPARAILSLADVRHFLYLIDPWPFGTAAAFLAAVAATSYDAVVVDLDFDGAALTADQVAALRAKPSGARRLVLCYLSIGEAEDYRDYWRPEWNDNPPPWLLAENPDWPGNYPVRFWLSPWRDIVFARLDAILDAGLDGVYLDRVDVYEAFES